MSCVPSMSLLEKIEAYKDFLKKGYKDSAESLLAKIRLESVLQAKDIENSFDCNGNAIRSNGRIMPFYFEYSTHDNGKTSTFLAIDHDENGEVVKGYFLVSNTDESVDESFIKECAKTLKLDDYTKLSVVEFDSTFTMFINY